jgi:uncharacterized protein involved in exopolysaccharide biosynthesis
LSAIIAILRRRAGLIALCVLVTAGAAFGFSELKQKQYSVSMSPLFRNPGFAEDPFGTGNVIAVNPESTLEAATNEKLVGLKVVAGRTAKP